MGSGSSTQKINTSQNNNQPASNDDVQKESPKQEDSANAKTEDEVKLPAVKTSSKVEPQHSQKNVSTSKLPQVHSTSDVTEKDADEIFPEDQQKFDTVLRFACDLVKPDSITKHAKPGLEKLDLCRALPSSISTYSLVCQLKQLQILNLSSNQLGPAGFNAVMLSLCQNTTITTLNIADNQTDTDCAESVGQALNCNKTLTCLDVSGNYLGKDYFSRCVGPALAANTTLKVLKCESIGATDFSVLGESLKTNKTLVSLNVNSNELSNAKPFIQCVSECIKSESSSIETLELRNTGIKGGHVQLLTDALQQNKNMKLLNISANQLASTSELMNLVLSSICHDTMKKLIAEGVKTAQVDTWMPKGQSTLNSSSTLEELNIFGCSLKDQHFSTLLKHIGQGKLSKLKDLNIGNNTDLTSETLETVCTLTKPLGNSEQKEGDEEEEAVSPKPELEISSLLRLNLSHNNVDSMIQFLLKQPFQNLKYLNLRRAKISTSSVGQLSSYVQENGLETIVLDAVKLSGSDAFQMMFREKPKLVALSLSSCQLNDDDLQPLWNAIKTASLPMHMLKLSANRITVQGILMMCEALQAHKTHPLALIDLSSNNVDVAGAKKLSELLLHKKHRSQLHSINLANNNIKGDGVVSLVSCITKSSLLSLNVCNQKCGYEEQDMDNIFGQLVKVLGLKVVQEDGTTKSGTAEMPVLPSGVNIKLQSLGGEPGEFGKLLDSLAIATDYNKVKLPNLTLQDALELASALKQCESSKCLLSSKEWNQITGLVKEAPSWLKIAENRSRAVYMTGLPAVITTQKMDGLLEMEADCNVEEVCLMKDAVTRKNNGNAWVLLSDEASAERAFELYKSGQALVFSQPFTISRLHVRVDDEANSEAETKAREDIEKRLKAKKKDEVAHKDLIHRAYIEGQERHAYRLAHPAYADGRIW